MLDQALLHADRALVPVSIEQLAVGTDQLRQHARTYRIECDLDAVAETHAKGCAQMPAGLYEDAVQGVLARWTDTYRLPPPGAFLDHVREAHARLIADRRKLETADFKLGRRHGDPSQPKGETIPAAEIDAVLRETYAMLGATR